MIKFLKLFTKVPIEEIKKLSKLKNQEINEAKILAFEVTNICRGKKAANEALEISENIFDKKINDDRINFIEEKIDNIKSNTITIIDTLEKLNLVKSRADAKRLIKSHGVKINNVTYKEENYSLNSFIKMKELKISVGKKSRIVKNNLNYKVRDFSKKLSIFPSKISPALEVS